MPNIPIHNETDYTLTDEMTQYILRDAQEYFGEEVQAIRVQSGLERHAFNARTHEVRYAFSPQDFGFLQMPSLDPEPIDAEPPRSRRRSSRRDAEPESDIVPSAFEDVADVEVEEETESDEISLESLDEGQENEEEDDIFTLDDQNDGEDDEEEDQEDQAEDDERFFDPDEYEE